VRVAVGWWVLIAGLGAACNSTTIDADRHPARASGPTATEAPAPTETAKSSATPQSIVTMAELRQRPLRFPLVGPATTCPADPQVKVVPNPNRPAEFAFGSGPAYVNGNNAWYAGPHGQGVNLLLDTKSSGPMLVCTRSLDGTGHLSLRSVDIPAQAREPWRLIATETPEGLEIQVPSLPDHWPVWSGSLTTDSQGCFGLQVDGGAFASMIVIMVLPGPVPPG